jgi:hypothetical protein
MDKLILLFIVLAILAVFIVLAIKGKKEIIYKMIYALCDEAEQLYGSKTGKLKFSYVLEKLYARLPSIIKTFITYKTLERWIEKALAEMKEYWAEQADINDDEPIIVQGFKDN